MSECLHEKENEITGLLERYFEDCETLNAKNNCKSYIQKTTIFEDLLSIFGKKSLTINPIQCINCTRFSTDNTNEDTDMCV